MTRGLSISSPAAWLEHRQTIWAFCNPPGCGRNAKVDLAALVARLGDRAADPLDLRPLLRCTACGKRGALVTIIPDYGAARTLSYPRR